MNTPQDVLKAIDDAISITDFGMAGMSIRGQILFKHLYAIREAWNSRPAKPSEDGWRGIEKHRDDLYSRWSSGQLIMSQHQSGVLSGLDDALSILKAAPKAGGG